MIKGFTNIKYTKATLTYPCSIRSTLKTFQKLAGVIYKHFYCE